MKSLAHILFLFSVVNLAIKFTNANNGLQHVLEIDVNFLNGTTKRAFIPETLFTECLGGNVLCPSLNANKSIDIRPRDSTGAILSEKIDENTMLEITDIADFKAILSATVSVANSESGKGLNDVRVKTYSCTEPPDAKLFASGSGDNMARIWDTNTGDELKEFNHNHAVTSVAFSPDNMMIASGSWDKTVKLFNASTGQILQTFQHPNPFNSDIGGVVGSLSFSPDGTKLVTGTYDGYTRMWDVRNGTLVDYYQTKGERVWDLSYSPDGKTVAIANAKNSTGNGHVWLWHVENGDDCLDWFQNNPAWGFKVWNHDLPNCLQKLNAHTDHVYSVAFSLDGNLMATASADHTVKIWETHNNTLVHTIGELDSNSFSYGHTNDVRCVTFSLNGNMLASGSDDGTVRVFTTSDWQLYDVFYYTNSDGEIKSVESVAFSPAGTKLIVGGFASTIMIIDLYAGVDDDPILQEIAVDGTVYSLAFRQQLDFETIYDRQLQFHCADNYVYNDTTATCEACPPGKYAQVLGVPEATFDVHDLTECISCYDDNHFNFRYTTQPGSGCLYCNAGDFYNHNNNACEECPGGWAGPAGTEASRCTECPNGYLPGYYDPHLPVHEHECEQCPPGREMSENNKECIACTRGKYNTEVGGTCKFCPAGKFTFNFLQKSTGCEHCKGGRFSIRDAEFGGGCIKCKDTEYLSLEDGKQVCKECNPYNFWLSRRETTYKNGWAAMKELYKWLQNAHKTTDALVYPVNKETLRGTGEGHLGHVFQADTGNTLVKALSGNLTDFTDFPAYGLFHTFCARLNVNRHYVNKRSLKMPTVQCGGPHVGKIFPFFYARGNTKFGATPYQFGYYIPNPEASTINGGVRKKRSLVDRSGCNLWILPNAGACYLYDKHVTMKLMSYNEDIARNNADSEWILDKADGTGDRFLTFGRCDGVTDIDDVEDPFASDISASYGS